MAKTILLVEDDLDIQRIYSEKLTSSGFEVFLAYDTSQATQLVKTKKIALILLDIMLPGAMNGFEFLKWLKGNESYKKIPVIVMTNLDSERDTAMSLGANDYLIKAETDLNLLVEKVKRN